MRNHPYTCTACGHGFDVFKHLRQHWDGRCLACLPPITPPPSQSPPPSPERRQIDFTTNLWLNDDNPWLYTNDNGDDHNDNDECNDYECVNDEISHSTSTKTEHDVITIPDDHPETIPKPYSKRDELLYTLLEAVEYLTEIVLGQRPTPTASTPSSTSANIASTENLHTSAGDDWQTVPGRARPQHREEQKHFQSTNMYTVLDSLPQCDPSPASEPCIGTLQHTEHASTNSQQVQHTRGNQRRPAVVVSKFPERGTTWAKAIPGNSSFSDIVSKGKNVVLFSDSICNRFSEWELNRKATNSTIKKKAFPGATALDLAEHHMHPYLKRIQPDIAIIHAGANDVLQQSGKDRGLTDAQINKICGNILTSGMIAKEYGVSKVCISSVLTGKSKNFQLSSIFINSILEKMCQEVGFDFIKNDNITYEFPTEDEPGLFYKDGLHLNDNGRDILMCNFINYLNNHD